LGKIELNAAVVDLLSLSAHKIGGPKGVGALCLGRGVRLSSLLRGGPQERERRAGTENVAGIVGFAAACKGMMATLEQAREIEKLREQLWRGIASLGSVSRNSPLEGSLPGTLNVSFAGWSADALVAALDLEGIAVSAGSACAAGASEPSHVLRALGKSEAEARDAIRFSLGAESTEGEVQFVVEALGRILARTAADRAVVGRR
jgi:cysteine desulfurase